MVAYPARGIMVIQQAQATRTRASTRPALPQALPDRVAQIIAIAHVWDVDVDRRGSDTLPSPAGGWAHCFTTTAMRGFLPRTIPATGD